jgi:hypothetical protein
MADVPGKQTSPNDPTDGTVSPNKGSATSG